MRRGWLALIAVLAVLLAVAIYAGGFITWAEQDRIKTSN